MPQSCVIAGEVFVTRAGGALYREDLWISPCKKACPGNQCFLWAQRPPGILSSVMLSSSKRWSGPCSSSQRLKRKEVEKPQKVRETGSWPEVLGSGRTCRTVRLRAGQQFLKQEGQPHSISKMPACPSLCSVDRGKAACSPTGLLGAGKLPFHLSSSYSLGCTS